MQVLVSDAGHPRLHPLTGLREGGSEILVEFLINGEKMMDRFGFHSLIITTP